MYLHQFPIDPADWKTLQSCMDRLFEDHRVTSWWRKLFTCNSKKDYSVTQLMYNKIPDRIRNIVLVVAYKYLDRLHDCHYRAPSSGPETMISVMATQIKATLPVKIEKYQTLHKDNDFLVDPCVTIVFYLRKTLQGCDLRVHLPGDIERILQVNGGEAVLFDGQLLHGAGDGLGPGVRECFVVHLPLKK